MGGSMNKYWLSSVARFAPPDDLGGSASNPGAGDVAVTDTPAGGSDQTPAGDQGTTKDDSAPVIVKNEKPSDTVRRTVAELKEKAAADDGKPPKQKSKQASGAQNGDKPANQSTTTPVDGNTATPLQGQSGAPSTWRAEEKALWESLPDAAKAVITR